MSEEQRIIRIQNAKIALQRKTINCSTLFDINDNGFYRLRHDDNFILDLAPLDALKADPEVLIPDKIFVRNCMQEVFDYLVRTPDEKINIVVGSPGVGKSLLSFLAALQVASIGQKKVLFMRKTRIRVEGISIFWMQGNSQGSVDVYVNRLVDREKTLVTLKGDISRQLLEVRADGSNLRIVVDGPNHQNDQDIPVDSDLVTSGGHPGPKREQRRYTRTMPLSAWSIHEMRAGMKALYDVPTEIVDMIYDTIGGDYRITKETINSILKGSEPKLWNEITVDDRIVSQNIRDLQYELQGIIDRLEEHQINKMNLCIAGTKMQGGEIDRLRSLHGSYMVNDDGEVKSRTSQFIASAFLCRALVSMISLKSIQQSLTIAKNSQSGSPFGWQFEYFGHKIFYELSKAVDSSLDKNNKDPRPIHVDPFEVEQGKVAKLNRSSLYWQPDIPNFPNIDAAIAINNVLYCLQYTIKEEHKFNYSTFVSTFWDQLPDEFKKRRGKNGFTTIKVIFVLPEEPNNAQAMEPNNVQATPFKVQLVKGGQSYYDERFVTEDGITITKCSDQSTAEPEQKKQKLSRDSRLQKIFLAKEFLTLEYNSFVPPLPFMNNGNQKRAAYGTRSAK